MCTCIACLSDCDEEIAHKQLAIKLVMSRPALCTNHKFCIAQETIVNQKFIDVLDPMKRKSRRDKALTC